MKYKVKANLLHDQLGKLREGQIIEPTKAQAGSIMDWLEVLEPAQASGLPKQQTDGAKSSASPAGQASPSQTLPPSKRGAKRKKADQ